MGRVRVTQGLLIVLFKPLRSLVATLVVSVIYCIYYACYQSQTDPLGVLVVLITE